MIKPVKLASRMARIGTETAFEAAARARALEADGHSIIHLEIGEPDFDTPANVREAAKAGLDAGLTHYPPFAGLSELRGAIAEDSTARKGFEVDPSNVFVTVGGKGVMVYAILALVEDGDEFGPEPIPEGFSPFRRIWRAFEDVDRYLTEVTEGTRSRSRVGRR